MSHDNLKTEKLDNEENTTQHIAQHYNSMPSGSLFDRTRSRIYYMRNFNNWIKSNLIAHYIKQVRNEMYKNSNTDRHHHHHHHNDEDHPLRVLDLCSGKGGDQMKWRRGEVSHVVFVDIASKSVEESKHRYQDMTRRSKEERKRQHNSQKIFSADFIVLDCFNQRLADALPDKSAAKFDLVSCQFALHYSFASYKQAKMLIQNAAENLRSGGYFIGTTTNAHEIVRRLREESTSGLEFDNEVFRIKFDTNVKETIPLFGAKYHFFLEGVVDCPEFLTYFPMVVEFAKNFGLTLIEKKDFPEYFYEHYDSPSNLGLLKKMSCFEPYPSNNPMSTAKDAYSSAEALFQEKHASIGTISKAEWDAINLYMIFAFRKD